jgi:hypothetical protein
VTIQERIRTMRGIVDAAGGRPLTKAQTADFRAASREVLDTVTDTFDGPAVKDLADAIKSADGIPDVADAFEGWAARHNNGRQPAGRVINDDDGPLARGSGCTGFPSSSPTARRPERPSSATSEGRRGSSVPARHP